MLLLLRKEGELQFTPLVIRTTKTVLLRATVVVVLLLIRLYGGAGYPRITRRSLPVRSVSTIMPIVPIPLAITKQAACLPVVAYITSVLVYFFEVK